MQAIFFGQAEPEESPLILESPRPYDVGISLPCSIVKSSIVVYLDTRIRSKSSVRPGCALDDSCKTALTHYTSPYAACICALHPRQACNSLLLSLFLLAWIFIQMLEIDGAQCAEVGTDLGVVGRDCLELPACDRWDSRKGLAYVGSCKATIQHQKISNDTLPHFRATCYWVSMKYHRWYYGDIMPNKTKLHNVDIFTYELNPGLQRMVAIYIHIYTCVYVGFNPSVEVSPVNPGSLLCAF